MIRSNLKTGGNIEVIANVAANTYTFTKDYDDVYVVAFSNHEFSGNAQLTPLPYLKLNGNAVSSDDYLIHTDTVCNGTVMVHLTNIKANDVILYIEPTGLGPTNAFKTVVMGA